MRVCFLCAVVLISFCQVALGVVTVGNLSVGSLKKAVGIVAEKPKLSWQLQSNERGVEQAAYQILVASSPTQLDRNNGDLWDSGKVTSSQSLDVTYSGTKLKTKQVYYWKVRIWDSKGKVSEYSQAHSWEMGIGEEEWAASWISAPKIFDWMEFAIFREKYGYDTLMNAAPFLKRDFRCQSKVAKARLYVSGVGYHETYINGKKVGDHVLDPAFTRYDKTVLYTIFDVTDLLLTGSNTIGTILGNGWYNMPTRSVWGFDKADWRQQPALKAQLEITYEDGRTETIVSDNNWKATLSPIRFNSVFQGEVYDARLEKPGYYAVGNNDLKWQSVNVVAGPKGKLEPQQMPPIREIYEITPVAITEPQKGKYVVDLGKNISGYIKLRVKAKAGTRISIKYGERLTATKLVDQEHIAMYAFDKPFQTDTYIARGTGEEEVWSPRFTYHGFQYMEIEGLPDRPEPDKVKAVVVHTDFETIGSFKSSNTLLNQIYGNTVNSYLTNYHGYPTDCPHREKNGWTGDAHLASEVAMYSFNVQSAYQKWLNDIADEQRPSGEVAGIVPTAGWGYFFGNGPAWDCSLFLIPWYIYSYTGDRSAIESLYPSIRRYVDFLSTKADSNHIVSWGLGDWCPAKTVTPAEITSTAYYYTGARILGQMAEVLGNKEDAQKYGELAKVIGKAFNQKFYKGNGSYGNGSQTALACAIYQGLAEEHLTETLNSLVAMIEANDNHLDCGILGTKYLINALLDNGRGDVAYRIINQRTFPSWGYWVEQGATTLWERWDGENSRNHPMFGDVGAWFYRALGGIRYNENSPGFKEISLKPIFPKDINWNEVRHESRYGLIESSWKRVGKRIQWRITIPPNTSATVFLPTNDVGKLLENGKLVNRNDLNCSVKSYSGNQKVVALKSGTYRLSFEEAGK